MSGLMKLLGFLLLLASVILVALLKFKSAEMQVWGLSPDVIATLFVGGVLSLGLAGVIEAISGMTAAEPVPAAVRTVGVAPEEIDQPTPINIGFGRKKVAPPEAPELAAIVPAAVAATAASNSVADTLAALEQAKSDIKNAMGGVENLSTPTPEPIHVAQVEPAVPHEPEIDDEPAADELFVVEEKIIRGRPSRVLSDDTVEAETDEGWMRFENLEHLNEYLDSVEESDT